MKLKQLVKDAVKGAFIPGNVMYNAIRWNVESDKAWEIKNNQREATSKDTLKDKVYTAIGTALVGTYDLAWYGFYSVGVEKMLGTDVLGGMQNVDSLEAGTIVALNALARAGVGAFYASGKRESIQEVQDAIKKRTTQ